MSKKPDELREDCLILVSKGRDTQGAQAGFRYWRDVVADIRDLYLVVTLCQAFLKQLGCYSKRASKLLPVLKSYVWVSAACKDAIQK